MLAGCAGGASQAGLGLSLPTTQSVTQPGFGRPTAQHSDHSRSRMAPDAKTNDLLYVSDVGTNDVYVYSYPKLKLEGTLTGFATPDGECVDMAGNVFITNFGTQQIFEYAHGGDPNRGAERSGLLSIWLFGRSDYRKSGRREL